MNIHKKRKKKLRRTKRDSPAGILAALLIGVVLLILLLAVMKANERESLPDSRLTVLSVRQAAEGFAGGDITGKSFRTVSGVQIEGPQKETV